MSPPSFTRIPRVLSTIDELGKSTMQLGQWIKESLGQLVQRRRDGSPGRYCGSSCATSRLHPRRVAGARTVTGRTWVGGGAHRGAASTAQEFVATRQGGRSAHHAMATSTRQAGRPIRVPRGHRAVLLELLLSYSPVFAILPA